MGSPPSRSRRPAAPRTDTLALCVLVFAAVAGSVVMTTWAADIPALLSSSFMEKLGVRSWSKPVYSRELANWKGLSPVRPMPQPSTNSPHPDIFPKYKKKITPYRAKVVTGKSVLFSPYFTNSVGQCLCRSAPDSLLNTIHHPWMVFSPDKVLLLDLASCGHSRYLP